MTLWKKISFPAVQRQDGTKTQPRLFFALGHRHALHHHRRHVDVVTLIAYETDPRCPKNQALSAKCAKQTKLCVEHQWTPAATPSGSTFTLKFMDSCFFQSHHNHRTPYGSVWIRDPDGTKQHTHQSHIVHQGLKQTAALLASASEQGPSSLGTAWAILGHPGPITLVQQVLNDLGTETWKHHQEQNSKNHEKKCFSGLQWSLQSIPYCHKLYINCQNIYSNTAQTPPPNQQSPDVVAVGMGADVDGVFQQAIDEVPDLRRRHGGHGVAGNGHRWPKQGEKNGKNT